ncbi:EamA domain-containing membrane protein RarD [Rhodoferax sp. OV413]|uniref:DMT family transporter n=1 Tax=Rhodoferax sp. OV413 TaxID=1855285 RepID=UPI000891DBFC|nr:DMT family transporter [Rhodoferax sp. OV413]SDP82498.1 EamA domain-containing membrane protein RarD [Rhodoferax sp. OV413]
MHNPTALALPLSPASPSLRERQGQWLLIAGGVLLGTIGVFVEEAGQHPLTTVWFRCVFGALALLLWGAGSGRLRELRLHGRSGWVAALTGGLMVLNWVLFFAAIARTSIGVATVVFHIQPIWVMILGAWLLRETVSARQWAATLVALCGLALTTGLLNDIAWPHNAGDGYLLGLLMCVGGSLSYAAVTLIAKTERRLTPFALAWWQCAVGVLILAWVPAVYGWPTSGSSWAWLAGLGVIHTGLAYAILFTGMARLAIGKIAVLQFVYPLAAVVVDWLVYGRTLQTVQLGGVALMALALWTIRKSPTAAPK